MTLTLTKSKDFTEEYCCSVVKVGELTPVENSDRLMQTRINGESIVVNKQDVKEGDVMLYISNECQIAGWFLAANNMYRHYTLNCNSAYVEEGIKADPDFLKTDEGKAMVGYFEDNGRVKMIKLRGCPSFGVLFKPLAMELAFAHLGIADHDKIYWDTLVGTDFDQIYSEKKTDGGDGENTLPFVRAYVPPRNTPGSGRSHGMKGVSRWDRLNRMVPGQFKLHYDTAPLKKHLMDFKPSTRINVTVKIHGTSFICGNLLTNVPLRFFRIRRWLNEHLHTSIKESRQEYGMIVSSRKVIKNEWSGCDHPEGFYGWGHDIWTEYGEMIFPYLDERVTVYGEICGYLTGDAKMIQNDYDYGCRHGENFLMLYRATKHEDGKLREFSIDEVGHLTEVIKVRMSEAGDKNVGRIFNIKNVELWQGTVEQLIGIGGDMRDFPDRLADVCKIEGDEPLCSHHKVPREGVVVRINGDEVPEAFKLKSLRFLEREKKSIDKGEVDMEMQEVATDQNE